MDSSICFSRVRDDAFAMGGGRHASADARKPLSAETIAMPEIEARMRTKFSELAEVVRRLNNPEKCSTSGQKDFLPATSDRYELEVDGILRDAAGKLSVFLSAAEKRVAQTHKAKDSVPFHTSKTDFEKRLAAKTKEFETAKKANGRGEE